MSINRPLGTYVTDGIRTGPFYPSHSKYGPGILNSPLNTYSIVPNASAPGNVAMQQMVPTPGYIPLKEDGTSTFLKTDPTGKPYLQLDWPRVIGVRILGVNLTTSINVTIFGTDYYGFPLQHTYNVQNMGFYPGVTDNFAYNIDIPSKAFYTVTGVYFNGTTNVGASVAIEATTIFGLPYSLNEYSDIIDFTWNDENMWNQFGVAVLGPAMPPATGSVAKVLTPAFGGIGGILPFLSYSTIIGTPGFLSIGNLGPRIGFNITSTSATDTSVVNWMLLDGGTDLLRSAADAGPPSAASGDVRGLFQLPSTGESWGQPPDGIRRAVITSYVYGADQFQNQLAAAGQPQGTAGSTTPFLNRADLYGLPQYYTGVPA